MITPYASDADAAGVGSGMVSLSLPPGVLSGGGDVGEDTSSSSSVMKSSFDQMGSLARFVSRKASTDTAADALLS